MTKVNWHNVFFGSMALIIISMTMKLSASYEGCLLLNSPYRLIITLPMLIVGIAFLIPLRRDIARLFISEVQEGRNNE